VGLRFIRIVGADIIMNKLVNKANFAVAAVAACAAFFTEVIGTGILGALYANAGGLFFTDTTDKWHGCDH
jgi:hypothetical protein